MTDLEDGDGSVHETTAGDEVPSSNERRGCKRRLEDAPSKELLSNLPKTVTNELNSEVNASEEEPAVMTTVAEETGEEVSPSGTTSDNIDGDVSAARGVQEEHTDETNIAMNRPADESIELPEGMLLVWNSDKTSAILTISELSSSATTSADRELRVCLVGRATVRVVEGSAEILGHTLESPKNDVASIHGEGDDDEDFSHTDCGVVVTSPYWSSWMTIEANPLSLPCKIVLDCVRGSESFTVTAPKRPIILPKSWRICGDGIVQDFCKSGSDLNPSNQYRGTAVMADSLEDYGVNASMHSTLDRVRRVCMITGAKGVGKSTLLRYLTNRILSASSSNNTGGIEEVAILDTDVGQPELAPPGLLRLSVVRKPLLHPPYWNLVGKTTVDGHDEEKCSEEDGDQNDEQQMPCYGPQQQEQPRLDEDDLKSDDDDEEEDNDGVEVVSSVFFGASTSKVDPSRYINAIQFLMGKYETEVAQSGLHPIPVLINMDGWVKGVGYEILSALIDSLGPTHLVQILGETPGQIFDLPPSVRDNRIEDGHDEAPLEQQTASATTEMPSSTNPPKVFKLEACQTLQGASLCKIPALTMRNFRWAAYFLPNELQTIDAWDFVSAKSLQTGWIAATNSDKTASVPSWWHTNTIGAVDDDKNNMHDVTTNADEGELNDDCRLAKALARERPYCVPMEAVDAFVIGSDFEDYLQLPIGETDTEVVDQTYNRIFKALNGCIVALCTNTTTMESLGYGILRSIDWEKRLLYVLVPPSLVTGRNQTSSSALLSRVVALGGGNLGLPLAMLYRGVFAESFPYLTTNHNPAILGSEPMKSRNNIGRRGLANAERNANG